MIALATEIVTVLRSSAKEQSEISVGNITLSGRRRVPHREAPTWQAAPGTPISEESIGSVPK